MVCEELDQLEWDFIQARAGSLDVDSFGWTNREFSCLDAILDRTHEAEHWSVREKLRNSLGLLGTFAYDPHSGLAGVLVEMHLVEVLQE